MENYIIYVYGVIYQITNLVNGKVYIGQTVRGIRNRLNNHCCHATAYLTGKYKGRDTSLFRAIRKYGRESFSIHVICSCQSKEELDLMEDLYIVLLGGYSKKTGYNIRRGGAHGKMSDEVRAAMSLLHRGEKHSEEHKKKMSIIIKELLAKNPRPPVSEETRKRMSESQRKRGPQTETSRQKMREWRLHNPNPCFKTVANSDLIYHLYSLNYSSIDIAKVIPVSSGTILNRLRKLGLTRKVPKRYLEKPMPIEDYMLTYQPYPGPMKAGPKG